MPSVWRAFAQLRENGHATCCSPRAYSYTEAHHPSRRTSCPKAQRRSRHTRRSQRVSKSSHDRSWSGNSRTSGISRPQELRSTCSPPSNGTLSWLKCSCADATTKKLSAESLILPLTEQFNHCNFSLRHDECPVKAGSSRLPLVDLIAIQAPGRMLISGHSPGRAIDPKLSPALIDSTPQSGRRGSASDFA